MSVISDVQFTDTLVSLIYDTYLLNKVNSTNVSNYWHFLQNVSNCSISKYYFCSSNMHASNLAKLVENIL